MEPTPLKVLHVPFTYHPDPCGGTEIYVAGLCHELELLGITSMVAAPGERNERYRCRETEVWRFAATPVKEVGELYDEGDPTAAEAFERVLHESKPDVVHFHARTRAASLRCVRKAKALDLRVVYTYHTPTATCQRGTMMREGTTVCDGEMRIKRCGACVLSSRLPSFLAKVVGALPPALGRSIHGQGGLWTALRMSHLSSEFQRHTRLFLDEVDQVVAVCGWVKQVLLNNGVSAHKITLCRQGLSGRLSTPITPKVSSGPLKLAFLGRLDPTKGMDVLLRAIRMKPDLNLILDVYGVAQGDAGYRYRGKLHELACADTRIRFREPVPGADVIPTLRGYDLLAVPSQWLETGPLVVLEAFAAGIPVIGSRLGGVAELVTDGVDGILVDADDFASWGNCLMSVAHDRSRLSQLRKGVGAPRTMQTVAGEMKDLYQRVLAGVRKTS